MQTCDVMIIGAGPAGSMAARELEANKVNYLIIQAKSKIGSFSYLLETFGCTPEDSI